MEMFARLLSDLPSKVTVWKKFKQVGRLSVKLSTALALVLSLLGILTEVYIEAQNWRRTPLGIGCIFAFLLVMCIESGMEDTAASATPRIQNLWITIWGILSFSIKMGTLTPILYLGAVILECLAKNFLMFILIWILVFPVSFYICFSVEVLLSYGMLSSSWPGNNFLKHIFT